MKRNDIVIAIPVYKLRYTELIDGISKDIDLYKNKYDIIIFSQSNDVMKDEYYKYKTDYIDVIEVNATNLAEKRREMYDKCIAMGYKKMFQIDDDMKYEGQMIDETTKRTTSNSYKKKDIKFNLLLEELLLRQAEYDAAYASFKIDIYLFAGRPGKINKNTSLNAGGFVLLDLEKLVSKGVTYRWTDYNSLEDFCFVIDALMKGLDVITIDYMTYKLCNGNSFSKNTKDSVIFNTDYDRYRLILWDAYHYNVRIRIDKRGILHRKIRWADYYNKDTMPILKKPEDIEINKMIKEYIEEHNTVDEHIISKVIEKLKYFRDLKNKNK